MFPLQPYQFYPDKPTESTPSQLSLFKNHTATSKLDGYNLFLCNIDGKIFTYSRKWNVLPVAEHIKEDWKKYVIDKKIPNNSIMNCEWMKYRAGSDGFVYDGPECIYFLTPYAVDGIFVGHLSYTKRLKYLEDLEIPRDNIDIINSSEITHTLMLPCKAENDFEDFFEKHKNIPRTEGIVVSKNNGHLYASQHASTKTKMMLKVKYRKGDAGQTRW